MNEALLQDSCSRWPKVAAARVRAAVSLMRTAAENPIEKGRLGKLRGAIYAVMAGLPISDFQEGLAHLNGVAFAAALLAKRRGEAPELAAMAGLLHDFYGYIASDTEDHGRKGAACAAKVLETLGLASDDEIDAIASAIYVHSDKGGRHTPFEEILVDADVLQHGLYDPAAPLKPSEKQRFDAVCRELGIQAGGVF